MLFVLNLILKEAALLLFRVFVMNLLISIILFLLIIESENRSAAGPSVKAKGLFLVNVSYQINE